MIVDRLQVRFLGLQPYEPVWQSMSTFTDSRNNESVDELWLVQHSPVFTQGQAGKPEHVLNPGNIPIVQSDRGGQVTYHGPGQLVLYPLIDLRRRKLGVRDMITLLEETAVELLANYGISAHPKVDAPGVYVSRDGIDDKIASLGLRVRKGCCFHGMSINVDMDLSPFELINPCGYEALRMTQMKDLPTNQSVNYDTVEKSIVELIKHNLKISSVEKIDTPLMR